MASTIRVAVANRMINDVGFAAMNSTYAASPAIFAFRPVPEDAELPYTVLDGPISGVNFDTKEDFWRDVWYDVMCFTLAVGNRGGLEDMVELVKAIFHRQPLSVEGFNLIRAEATPPMVTPSGDLVAGMRVGIHLLLEED